MGILVIQLCCCLLKHIHVIIVFIIILNLEIVEAMLINIVELFPDPEHLSEISINLVKNHKRQRLINAMNIHI